jgi:leader peptidase (prepilin peptidase) / N-methyltransferase
MVLVWAGWSLLLGLLHGPMCSAFIDGRRSVASRVFVPLSSAVIVSVLASGVGAWVSAARVVFVLASSALTEIDLRVRRLPREISYPAAVVSFVLLTIDRPDHVGVLLIGAVAPTAFLAFTLWCSRRQLGSGDVRMAPLLGMHLASISGAAILEGFLFAFLIAGLVVLVLIVMGRANRSTTLPFGPFLVAGTLSVMVIHA